MLVVLALLVLVCVLVFLWIQNKFNFWNDRGFVSPPTVFPFGNLKGVGTKMPSFAKFEELYCDYKGKAKVVGIYLFLTPTLMILDLELLKNVFIRDFASFHDRGFYFNKKDDPLSANLVRFKLNLKDLK